MGLLVLVKWYYIIGALMFFFYSMRMVIIERPVLEWNEWHCRGNYYIRAAVLPLYVFLIITMMPLVYGGAFFLCIIPEFIKGKPYKP